MKAFTCGRVNGIALRAGPDKSRFICKAKSNDQAAQFIGTMLAASVTLSAASPASAAIEPVYFGNGCFWGRQKDFVDTEMRLGRDMTTATAVVGYAGGKDNSKTTCYYYNAPGTLYEKQGHAEVVQVGLDLDDVSKAEREMAAFADTYFSQFKRTRAGMIRQDPQDKGPGYRNVVGLPGGVGSPLFPVFKSKNVNGMKLVPSDGGGYDGSGRPLEDDAVNTVYIVDSTKLPFHPAEVYHQFHDGIGKSFPQEYRVGLKKAKLSAGEISNIPGCLEYPF